MGLLGGSLAKDISKWKNVSVVGFCRNDLSTKMIKKLRLGCDIQNIQTVKGKASLNSCDLVVLAMPVQTIAKFLDEEAIHAINPMALVTDVGSTKTAICKVAKKFNQSKERFVGSHPMAGSEKQGAQFAEMGLFINQTCFVVTDRDKATDAVERIARFWKMLGSNVVFVDAKSHDRIVAKISHMPHIAATLLIQSLMQSNTADMEFGRSGLASIHRAAGSNPAMWSEIIQENKTFILQELDVFIKRVVLFKSKLEKNSSPSQFTNLLSTQQYDEKYRTKVAKYEKTSRSN